jgi:hypothetical protein
MRSQDMSRFHLHAVDHSKAADQAPVYEVFVAVGEHDLVDGEILLSSGCKTGAEIDEWVDRLITQLNAIRHKAKEKLGDRLKE